MATKVLLNRTMSSPLAELSLNKPRALTSSSRKRSATFFNSMPIQPEPIAKKRRTTVKKSVRFHPTASASSSNVTLDEELFRSLWYSPQDLQQIRQREANVVKSLRFCGYYLQQMTCLLGVACGATTQDPMDAQVFCSNSPARGLEREMLECIRQRRKQIVRTFLNAQKALQKRQLAPALKEQALSQHYTKLARPSLRLGQLIAQGDAMVLQEEFYHQA